MTTVLHVADDGTVTVRTWPGSETGRCARCGVAARVYGPHGAPLCADCGPSADRKAPLPAPVPSPRAAGPAAGEVPQRGPEAELALW